MRCCLVAGLMFVACGVPEAGSDGDTAQPLEAVPPMQAVALAAGRAHTCALEAGAVWCWGANDMGQLGDGTRTSSSRPVAVPLPGSATAIAAAHLATCAVVSGAVFCWGVLDDEQHTPVLTPNPKPTAVAGVGQGVTTIAVGQRHACAIKNGDVWCWGSSDFGELGAGRVNHSVAALRVDGLPAGVSTVAVSSTSSCAIASGAVWCWGYRHGLGPQGNGPFPGPTLARQYRSHARALTVGEDWVCAGDGVAVACWWNGAHTAFFTREVGQLPPATALHAGDDDTWGVANGGLYRWVTWSGSTGDATRVAPALTKIHAIAVGWQHQCVATPKGIYCMGTNAHGQLGDGTTTDLLPQPRLVQ